MYNRIVHDPTRPLADQPIDLVAELRLAAVQSAADIGVPAEDTLEWEAADMIEILCASLMVLTWRVSQG